MADLHNLLDELEQQQQHHPSAAEAVEEQEEDFASTPKNADASQEEDTNDNDNNDNGDRYRQRLDLPLALAEAASRLQKSKNAAAASATTPATVRMSMETQTTANCSFRHNDDEDIENENNDEEPLNLEDLMRVDNKNQDGGGGGGLYRKLDHWWVQELHSPELMPYNEAVMDEMLHTLEMAEEHNQNQNNGMADNDNDTTNLNMLAILSSIYQIDKERVQFVLSHLIKTRLQKIQQQAWFIAREQTDRLSQREVSTMLVKENLNEIKEMK
jgi:hypothetical protein